LKIKTLEAVHLTNKTLYPFMITTFPLFSTLIFFNDFLWLSFHIQEYLNMLILYNFMLFVLSFFHFSQVVYIYWNTMRDIFIWQEFIMLYIVIYYCWQMYYCYYLLCGGDPCKLDNLGPIQLLTYLPIRYV
jgi:hypothetical protein